jgi:hypothetical protein
MAPAWRRVTAGGRRSSVTAGLAGQGPETLSVRYAKPRRELAASPQAPARPRQGEGALTLVRTKMPGSIITQSTGLRREMTTG